MDAEKLEILISKYIDSEITPDEQLMLELELKHNPESQELLHEMVEMHKFTSEAFEMQASENKSFEDVYSAAQEQIKPKNIKFSWLRFSSGLAAGLFVGIFLQFGVNVNSTTPRNYALHGNNQQLQNAAVSASPIGGAVPVTTSNQNRPVIRNVDVYHYTDQNGKQYIITGYRDNMVKPVVNTKSF